MKTITVMLTENRLSLHFNGNVKLSNQIDGFVSITLIDKTGTSITHINKNEIASIDEYMQ